MPLSFLDRSTFKRNDKRIDALVHLLSANFYRTEELPDLVLSAGLPAGDLTMGNPKVRTWWRERVYDFAAQNELRQLVDACTRYRASFCEELVEAIGQLQADSWYPEPVKAWDALFVGFGSKTGVIALHPVRAALRDMCKGDSGGFILSGGDRVGKSHSWQLIEHVASGAVCTTRVQVERLPTASGRVTAWDLDRTLRRRLGMVELDQGRFSDPHEQPDATGRILLDQFIGHYPQNGQQRWIVIDGLDRIEAADCARSYGVGLLQAAAQEREIRDTLVMLTGFDGAVSEQLTRVAPRRELRPLDMGDLVDFFEGLSLTADRAEARRLAEEAFRIGSPSNEKIAQAAVESALKVFA